MELPEQISERVGASVVLSCMVLSINRKECFYHAFLTRKRVCTLSPHRAALSTSAVSPRFRPGVSAHSRVRLIPHSLADSLLHPFRRMTRYKRYVQKMELISRSLGVPGRSLAMRLALGAAARGEQLLERHKPYL